MLLAVGFGMSVVFQQKPWLHVVIQVAGLLYLAYLAFRIARAQPSSSGFDDDSVEADGVPPLSFMQAAAFQWINPKAWMMGTGAIAAFTTSESGGMHRQIIYIAVVFAVMALLSAGLWLCLGSMFKKMLANKRIFTLFNYLMALLLLLSVAPVVVSLLGRLFS